MLVEEGGNMILCRLHDDVELDSSVRAICHNILDVLATQQYGPQFL
jgi:hypothetical protein